MRKGRTEARLLMMEVTPEMREAGLSADMAAGGITIAMLEAGFRVLSRSGIADECSEADKVVVAEIYLAMRAAAVDANAGEVLPP